MSDIQVVLVHKKGQEKSEESATQLERRLNEIKLTNNLIKEINFNSTINRFEYLQQLLRKEHDKFIASMTQIINKQRQVIKEMKNLQKQLKEMRLPAINYNRLIVQSQELIKVKHESDKNSKLSKGMLLALSKMENELDNYQKRGSSQGLKDEILM